MSDADARFVFEKRLKEHLNRWISIPQDRHDPRIDVKPSGIGTRLNETNITLMGHESQVNELVDLIDLWNRDGMSQMVVDIRIMQGPEDLVSSRGITWSPILQKASHDTQSNTNRLKEGAHGRAVNYCQATISYDVAFEIVKALQADRRSNITFTPTATPLNSARVHMQSVETGHRFITGFTQGPGNTFRPVIEHFPKGISMHYQVAHKRGNPQIHLDGQVNLTELISIESQTARTGNGQEITFQIPDFATTRIPINAHINRKETLLISIQEPGKRYPTTYFLMTPRVVTR